MVGRRLRPGSVFSVPLCFIFFDQATGDTRDELETQRRRGHGGRWGDGRQATDDVSVGDTIVNSERA